MSELPIGWALRPLSAVTNSISNGFTYSNAPQSGGLPISRIQTISHGQIDFEAVGYAGLSADSMSKHLLQPGDILFSHINSKEHVGKVAIYKTGMRPLLHGMNLLRIVANELVLPEFLFWALRSDAAKSQIFASTRHAVNQASINIRNLQTVLVPVPPLDEQQRIVATLEDHLSRLDKANVETDLDVALAHLRKAFYSQAVDVLYKEALSFKRLDEVAHVQLGRQRSPSNAAGPNMRSYLRAANVTWSGLDFDDVLEMNFTDKEMDTFRLVSGDILINEASGSAKEVGKPAIFKGEISDCAFQNHLIRIRSAGVSTEYLFGLLFHNAISGAYVAESQGVGINHLGKAKVAQWKIPIVNPNAETRFVENISTFENNFLKLRDEIGEVKYRLKAMRRALLQDAFTGKLVENV